MRQPVQQFRMGRLPAQPAKVAGSDRQSFAKMLLPNAVDHDPRSQGVVRMGQPGREGTPAASAVRQGFYGGRGCR